MRIHPYFVHGFLGAAWLLAVVSASATASATVIYDDFSGPAGDLPSAALWTVTNNDGGNSSLLDGNGVLNQLGGSLGTELLSTGTFASGRFGFQFAGVASASARGYGITFDPYSGAAASRILLRTDFGGELKLDLYDGATQSGTLSAALTYDVNDLWELDYAPGTLTVYRNGSAVIGPTAISITATTAKFSMFSYGGGAQSFDYVSVPEPGSLVLVGIASLCGLGFVRRKRC